MQLNPEQQQQVGKARETGEQSVKVAFTAEQKSEWEAAVQEELASKQENIAHFRKIQAAAKQPGFLGDVRRAITYARRPVTELAAETGISASLLSDFRAGEADLPAVALDQLIEILGLRLMQEIPRDKADGRRPEP